MPTYFWLKMVWLDCRLQFSNSAWKPLAQVLLFESGKLNAKSAVSVTQRAVLSLISMFYGLWNNRQRSEEERNTKHKKKRVECIQSVMVLIYGAAISYRPIRSIENNQFFFACLASLLDHSIKSTRERKIDGNNWPIRSDTWTKKWVFIFHKISIFLQAEQKPKMPLMPFNHIQLREFLLRLSSLASFEIFCWPRFCVLLSHIKKSFRVCSNQRRDENDFWSVSK